MVITISWIVFSNASCIYLNILRLVSYLSANDLILGMSGGGVPGLDGFGGPIGFLALPVTDGNFRPYFPPLVVDSGTFSAAASGLNPGGRNEESKVESVSMLSNKEEISNLKSELDAEEFSIFSFGSSLSSVGGLNPGGRNALTSWNTTWKKIKKIVLLLMC